MNPKSCVMSSSTGFCDEDSQVNESALQMPLLPSGGNATDLQAAAFPICTVANLLAFMCVCTIANKFDTYFQRRLHSCMFCTLCSLQYQKGQMNYY